MEVNYRTVAANLDAGRLSRRMRAAVQRFESKAAEADAHAETSGPTGAEADQEQSPVAEMSIEARAGEVRQLRETVQAQADQLEELGRRVAEMEGRDSGRVEAAGEQGTEVESGLPDAGMVTLETQPDEEHAFGPAAGLVAEWRGLRTVDTERGSSMVDKARAEERRWQLEVQLIEEYGLTVPPEREPLRGARRDDHLRWRREALVQARRQRVVAERWRVVLKVVTLGLWRG